MTAPANRPGTGPESVLTLPMVMVSPVTPTSVAPPFPPAGAAAVGELATGALPAVGVDVAVVVGPPAGLVSADTASPLGPTSIAPTGERCPDATRSLPTLDPHAANSTSRRTHDA
jgi:hypothetical protein